ncbi:type 1 glutamine amidotransferase [Actinotalea sp. K2]|uniref:type 1 glutamine amidotransferase n=1 Tax=Actinotalea sp. K2 TaxID=2939438 RepID=UPI002017BA0E|nr:type 1 glutamine amidotransferase [Actinotalea sp. K2]MCL3861526.1 type 1 glutamine amidotransferase [Actinotalea sp. K2]
MILTVIEHTPDCPVDRLGPWLTESTGPAGPQVTLRIVRAWSGDAVPAGAHEVGDGLVVLGGHVNAYDDELAPWLPATRHLLADVVAAGVPALGVCLGAQLLAVATGGRVQVGAPPGREAGVIDVHPRPEAAADPLLGGLAAQVPADHPASGGVMLAMPSMHADAVVDLPRGAVWLASSRLYPFQAFRVGSAAWGVQFHPEASPETVERWADEHDDVDTAAVVSQLVARDDEVASGGRALAHRFVELVADGAATAARSAQPATSSEPVTMSSASRIR